METPLESLDRILSTKVNTTIPSVPNNDFSDINGEEGLKNLAGWIARYHNLGLTVDDVSPVIRELLDNGTLAHFQPSLIGLKGSQSGGDEEYERYEFDVCIEDFVNINNHDWANLHFSFMANKCLMYIEDCNQSKNDNTSPALEILFGAICVEPLLGQEGPREITWQEADEIILKYLKFMKNPEIPPVPES